VVVRIKKKSMGLDKEDGTTHLERTHTTLNCVIDYENPAYISGDSNAKDSWGCYLTSDSMKCRTFSYSLMWITYFVVFTIGEVDINDRRRRWILPGDEG
jgi:hypothetical protein